jgi:hypothetical protein
VAPILGVLLILHGCAGPSPIEPRVDILGVEVQWSASVEPFERLRIRGQLQVEWTDDDGSHREQGDLDALLDGDRRTSMRLTKFGDVMLWISVTPTRAWIVDMLSDPSRLTVRSPEQLQGRLMVRPAVLRMLLGIDPWPADATVQLVDGSVVVTGETLGGQLTVALDANTLQPREIVLEFPNADRFVGRHRWTTGIVQVRDAPGGRALARVVDIVTPEGLLKIRSTTVQALTKESMSALGAIWFDLDRITAHLKPEVVE